MLVAALGCGGGGDDPSSSADAGGSMAAAATFGEIYPMIFPSTTNARCNFCHGMPASDTSNGSLSTGMDQGSAYLALVGKTSTSSHCKGKPLVMAGQPEQSLLLQKLGPNPPCGSRMPVGGSPLTDVQLEMVRSWIAAGAKND